MKLRGLVPNFHINVSVSDFRVYIPMIGPPICCSKIGGAIAGVYKCLTDK